MNYVINLKKYDVVEGMNFGYCPPKVNIDNNFCIDGQSTGIGYSWKLVKSDDTVVPNSGWINAPGVAAGKDKVSLQVDFMQEIYNQTGEFPTYNQQGCFAFGNSIKELWVGKHGQNPDCEIMSKNECTFNPTIRLVKSSSDTTLSLSQASHNVAETSDTIIIDVTNTGTGPTMGWVAEANDSWLTIESGDYGENNGTITVRYDANSGEERTGTITVVAPGAENGSQIITVKQAPKTDVDTLSVIPISKDIPSTSGSFTLDIRVDREIDCTIPGGCPPKWTVESNDGWLTTTFGTDPHSSIVTVNYQENVSDQPRIGTITITSDGAENSPQTVTVTQAKSEVCQAELSVNPAVHNVSSEAGQTSFNISANECPITWTVKPNVDWLEILPTLAHEGFKLVGYTANTGEARTGTVTVTAVGAENSPQTFTIKQAGFVEPVEGDVRGSLWIDMNVNGIEDAEDTSGYHQGWPEAEIRLINQDNQKVCWTGLEKGNSHDDYSYYGNWEMFCPVGNYKLKTVLPPAWKQITPAQNTIIHVTETMDKVGSIGVQPPVTIGLGLDGKIKINDIEETTYCAHPMGYFHPSGKETILTYRISSKTLDGLTFTAQYFDGTVKFEGDKPSVTIAPSDPKYAHLNPTNEVRNVTLTDNTLSFDIPIIFNESAEGDYDANESIDFYVTGANGYKTEIRACGHVPNTPPTIDAGANIEAKTGEIVQFQGSYFDPDVNDEQDIVWSFGDYPEKTSRILAPTHTYSKAGTYKVTLTATYPDDGGEDLTTSDSLTVTVTDKPLCPSKPFQTCDYTLSITKEGDGSGSITSMPIDIACDTNSTDCKQGYASGTPVTLTATPDSGSIFLGWNGACKGGKLKDFPFVDETSVVAMDADRHCTAHFATDTLISRMIIQAQVGILSAVAIPAYNCYIQRSKVLEAFKLLDGLKMSVEEWIAEKGQWPTDITQLGVATTGNYVDNVWLEDSVVKAQMKSNAGDWIADSIITSAFDSENQTWQCTSDIPKRFLQKDCESSFQEEPSFSLGISNKGDSGSVSKTPTGSIGVCGEINYSPNTEVTLTAVPDAGFVFKHFLCTGDNSLNSITNTNPRTIKMDTNKSCNVFFAPAHTLTVSKTGDGSITSSPVGINCGVDCEQNYATNTPVILTATPNIGSIFTGWTGDNCNGTNPVTAVTMEEAKNCTANFELEVTPCDSTWLDNLITKLKNAPNSKLPHSIYQYSYHGKTVYYVPHTQCCDQYSTLYNVCGEKICAPDGGIAGKGDGKCPDFFNVRQDEKVIFKQKSSSGKVSKKVSGILADVAIPAYTKHFKNLRWMMMGTGSGSLSGAGSNATSGSSSCQTEHNNCMKRCSSSPVISYESCINHCFNRFLACKIWGWVKDLFSFSTTYVTFGKIQKNETVTAKYAMSSYTTSSYMPKYLPRKVTTYAVTWPGSDLDLAITTPSGKKLTPSSPEVLAYSEEETAEYYVVASDEEGEWLVDVTGIEVDEGGEPYELTITTIDGAELLNQLTEDTDNDGLPDEWETYFLGDLTQDGTSDADKDGVSNLREYQENLNPASADTDGDDQLDAQEIENYTALGTLKDKQSNPIVGATIDIDGQTTTTDTAGNWEIPQLAEGEYTLTASKDGFAFLPQTIELGNEKYLQSVELQPLSELGVWVKPATRKSLKQGENQRYTVTVINGGESTATGVNLLETLPEGSTLVSLTTLDGGSCDAQTLTCQLPDLSTGQSARVAIEITDLPPNGLRNLVTVSSNEYPEDVKKSWNHVDPYLSVQITDQPDPVLLQGKLHYELAVDLNEYAPNGKATGIELTSRLPQGTQLDNVSTDDGQCTHEAGIISCSIDDLSIAEVSDKSHAIVNVDVTLQDAGLLILNHEATVKANEYPSDMHQEKTKVFVGDTQVDMVLVLDTTHSMQEEINGVLKALKQYLEEKMTGKSMNVALIEFKDDVWLRAFTSDMSTMLKAVEAIEVSGGGTCPEASVEALNLAVDHLKDAGVILFSTDASPYEEADVDALFERIKDKQIQMTAVITGDCGSETSWNDVK